MTDCGMLASTNAILGIQNRTAMTMFVYKKGMIFNRRRMSLSDADFRNLLIRRWLLRNVGFQSVTVSMLVRCCFLKCFHSLQNYVGRLAYLLAETMSGRVMLMLFEGMQAVMPKCQRWPGSTNQLGVCGDDVCTSPATIPSQ